MKPDGEFEPEQLEEFIDQLKSGKIQPYMRSMAVPKKQDNLPVLKIVANNYDKEIHRVMKRSNHASEYSFIIIIVSFSTLKWIAIRIEN
jgi:hypothetical protein